MINDKLIINDIMKSKKMYKELIKELNFYFYDNIGEEGCFDKTISFKFNNNDLFKQKMKINRFLIQMILWKPFVGRGIKLDSSFKMKGIKKFNNDRLKEYYNDKIINKCIDTIDIKELNVIIAEVQEGLKKISEDFSMILGLSFSIKDLCDLCEESEEIDKLLHYESLKNAQTQEVESDYNYNGNRLIELLKKYDSPYKVLLTAGEGVKHKQLQQYLMIIGYQSNMDGVTYPKPIEGSYMNRGLQKPSEHLLDSTMGRKAQIYQKVFTGDSGYFSRRFTYAAMDSVLHEDPNYSCNVDPNNLIKIHVESKAFVKCINGMYYKEKRNSLVYRCIDYRDINQTNKLVGSTIYLRSPLTCASKHGICHKCYGKLSKINYDVNIGILGAEIVASRLMQSILSSKHLLTTESISINLGEDYSKYFTIDANAILFDPEDQIKSKGKNKLYLVYSENDLNKTDEDDVMDEVEFSKSVSRFRIVNSSGETLSTISDEGGAELYLTSELESLAQEYITEYDNDEELTEYWVALSDLEPGEVVFYIEIVSKELKKPLNEITSLLDRKKHLGYEEIGEMTNRLIQLFIESKLGFNSVMVHTLTAMRDMVRNVDNIYERPDWSVPVYPDQYEILTIKDSIYNNGSILLTLSFEKMGQLLKKPSLFYRKSKESLIDPMFHKRLEQEA